MAWIIETPNPFDFLSIEKNQVTGGTIKGWVESKYPTTKDFPLPTVCLLNGQPLLREKWGHVIKERDVINFIAVQGSPLTLIITAVILVLAVVSAIVLRPVTPGSGEPPASDPVFTVKGQSNSIRLGEPIECSYGRNRIFPSYAARPYFRYISNDQFQYSLFCVGQGSYEVHDIQIGSTAIANYDEAAYEIIEPGSPVTLFPTNIYTSSEAGGQGLFADNQPEYPSGGWTGPFAANPSGTVTDKIEIDLVYPKGIYSMNISGEISWMTVAVRVEARLINDAGAPLGAFVGIGPQPYWSYAGASTTPQRQTREVTVPSGRYEVRIRNVGFYLNSSRVGQDVVWDGLRAWINAEHSYPGVTLLAVKIKATNNLNEQTQQQFSVICTRKLPIREASGDWSAPTASRSIVWALVDVFRASYGGRITDEIFFDWEALEELDALYTSRGDHFDWIFRDPITVWEAARTIALVGRAVPLIAGSLISMRRDGPLTVPVTLFNQENILEGSFEWSITFWDPDEQDCLRVEYTEVSTNYKQETVMAILPGGSSDNPKDLRLPGVQDRSHAYHEGLYLLASERYLRENVSFETGLEGYIPTYGDLVAVSHDVPKWGQSGYVISAERGEGDIYHLRLSEPLVWTDSDEHVIYLRSKKGEVVGPIVAEQTSGAMEAIIHSVEDIDFLQTGKTEPMLFLFGTAGEETKMMKVVRVEPQGGERIKITAVNDDPIIHSFDGLIPSALGENPYIPVVPDLPEVTNLYITLLDGPVQIIQVSWLSVFGALSYVVQTSEDGENWQERARTTRASIQLPARVGQIYVRVAAINNGQGPWAESSTIIGIVTGLLLSVPWDEIEWSIGWADVLHAVGWEVRIYDASGGSESHWVLKRTVTLDITDPRVFTYTYAMALADNNFVRNMEIEVDALFSSDSSTGSAPSNLPSILAIDNTLPTPPTDLAHAFLSEDGSEAIYRLTWSLPHLLDLNKLRIWISDVDGFNPAGTAPYLSIDFSGPTGWEGIESIYPYFDMPVALDSDGNHSPQYWRVGVCDIWGDEISTNVSEQATIPAYPP